MRFKINFVSALFALTFLQSSILNGVNANNDDYQATFFEGLAQEGDPYDSLSMIVKSECSNLPDVKTSPPLWRPWRSTVSDVVPPVGKCIRLFKELNCCGDFYDVSVSSHSELVNSEFNDKVVSFRDVDCDSPQPSLPSDCKPPEKDLYLAMFYEGWRYESGRHSFGFDVSKSCQTLPDLVYGNATWTFPIYDIYVPTGKCMRVYDEPDCGGNSFEYGYNGWSLYDADLEDRTRSFMEMTCSLEPTNLPCQAEGDQFIPSFSATFFEGYRSDKTLYFRNITEQVSSTCANIPTAWNGRVSDIVLPEADCICLFDQPNCGGESFYAVQTDDENNLVYNFNDKTKSYRSCYEENESRKGSKNRQQSCTEASATSLRIRNCVGKIFKFIVG